MTIDKPALKALAEAAPEGPWFGPEYAPGTSYVFDVDLGTLLEYQSIDTEKDACLRYVAAANPAAILALLAESDSKDKKINHSEQWYSCRFETLYHWAHRELNESQKTQYFNIVANGSSHPLDPPTYAQKMNVLKYRAESAEKERDMLKAVDWQAECLKKGFEYVREPDAHYVLADVPEMAALLSQLLGVEVRSKDNDDYGETVSSLNEQLEACNSVYGRAYDLEKEVESLRAEVARSAEREILQLAEIESLRKDKSEPCDSCFMSEVESLRKDAERNNRMLVSAAITIGEICEALGIDNHSEPDMIVEAVRELKGRHD